MKSPVELLRIVWERFKKPPDLPKYQPVESLDAHLRDRRQYAAENYGPIRPLHSFNDMRRRLAVIDRHYDIEIIGVKRVREYQPTVATNTLGYRLSWSSCLDTCHGWEQHQELARNGVDALKIIIDAIDLIKLEKPFGERAEWQTMSWTVEASSGLGWFHYKLGMIQKGDRGSYTTATLHFLLSDFQDLLFPS